MLGLSALDLGRLRMSVGYGTHKRGRPYSPIEIGSRLHQLREQGWSVKDCAQAVRIDGTGIGHFLRILKLPEDLQHLVDWGAGNGVIGFSTAVELVRLNDIEDQRIVADSILSDQLRSKEVRQVVQLRLRSGRSIRECVEEVLDMRPKIEKRHVFVGSIGEENLASTLEELTQAERDSVLQQAIEDIGLHGAAGRMGKQFFTLVGDDLFDISMNRIGKQNIEEHLRTRMLEII